MIKQIDIENFRSIKKQGISLKKLNILYGPNGAGKSSVMYAPYVFRNFCLNPNQKIDSLFNLGFINLGGFENTVSNNDINKPVSISFKFKISNFSSSPNKEDDLVIILNLVHEKGDSLWMGSEILFNLGKDIKSYINFDFPFTLTTKKEVEVYKHKFIWNGLTIESIDKDINGIFIAKDFNSCYESIKNIELISVKRGFFSPIFSTEQPTEESQFAFSIRNQEKDFESKIDYYFRQIFDKTFRFVAIPGSTSFYLRTQNKKGFTTDLVNEGFGVNQTIYMLIKLLKGSTSLAFIEEPEIHLHPSAQNKLVDVFTEITKKENKQIFLTTHSENIVSSVLNKIAKGELSTDDVQFYLAKVEDDETKIIPQNINEKGQIEGGLLSFMETELANLKTLLGI